MIVDHVDHVCTAAVQAGEVARALAFHDSEITALQGWAGGMPAVERPQPVLTRQQVPMQRNACLQSSIPVLQAGSLHLVERLV